MNEVVESAHDKVKVIKSLLYMAGESNATCGTIARVIRKELHKAEEALARIETEVRGTEPSAYWMKE